MVIPDGMLTISFLLLPHLQLRSLFLYCITPTYNLCGPRIIFQKERNYCRRERKAAHAGLMRRTWERRNCGTPRMSKPEHFSPFLTDQPADVHSPKLMAVSSSSPDSGAGGREENLALTTLTGAGSRLGHIGGLPALRRLAFCRCLRASTSSRSFWSSSIWLVGLVSLESAQAFFLDRPNGRVDARLLSLFGAINVLVGEVHVVVVEHEFCALSR